MDNTPNQIPCEPQAHSPLGHPRKSREQTATATLDTALRNLMPPERLTHQSCTALFEGRTPYPTIHTWRFRYRRWPQWAGKRLGDLLRTRAAYLVDLATQVEAEARTGAVGKRNIAAWHARKAAERDAKEKAGNAPALPPQSLSEPR